MIVASSGTFDRNRFDNYIESSLEKHHRHPSHPRISHPNEMNISWCGKSHLEISYPEGFLKSLEKLFASHNNIDEITINSFHKMPQLIDVDLSHNKIESVHPLAFRNLQHLESIDLSHNRIRRVEQSTFASLNNLNKLNLGYNLFDSNPTIYTRCSIWCKRDGVYLWLRFFCSEDQVQITLKGNPFEQISSTTSTTTEISISKEEDDFGLKPEIVQLICITIVAIAGFILLIFGVFHFLIPIYNQRKRMVTRKVMPVPPPIIMQRRRAAPNHYVV